MKRINRLLKTTAVRLTLVYTILFAIMAAGVVAYISFNTNQLLLAQFQTAVDEEVQQIARIARRRGINRLVPIIDIRSRRPGANLYLVADKSGRIIAGNVEDLDRSLLTKEGWRTKPFEYRRYSAEENIAARAIARVFTLPGDMKLLVGRDIGDAERFRSIVRRASAISLLVLAVTALAMWLFVGRRALRHIDEVSESSGRIIAGDLSQRLPVSGAGDEFDRLSGNLNRLIDRIEKLNTGVRDMSDSIAHDLKTPLTRLRNNAEKARQETSADLRDAALQGVVDEAESLIRTFDALLMISQVQSGARTARFAKIELAPIVADVCDLFQPLAEDDGIDLVMKTDATPTISGSRELIAQALTNLLDNALKYGTAARKPRIVVSLSQNRGDVIISVSDNGDGIAESDRADAVQRFVRLDKSRSRPGSGLGLSLVEAVVKLHRGNLELSDNKPGLTVSLRLPATA